MQEKGLSQNLIHPDDILKEIKNTLVGYFNLVIKLINGEMTVTQLIDLSKYNDDSVLSTSIAASNIYHENSIILPSHIN